MNLYPHTASIICSNAGHGNLLWPTLWLEAEPHNAPAQANTFTDFDKFQDSTVPGPAPFLWCVNTPLTATQKAELEVFLSGGYPQRWLDAGVPSGNMDTWRGSFVIEFDLPDHAAFVQANNLVPVETP